MLSSKFKCDKELHTSLKAQTSISQHWFTETEGFIILHRSDAYEVILHACKGPTCFDGLQVHIWETSSERGAKGTCILTETISNNYLPESALSVIDCTRFVVYIYKACDSTVSVVWRQTAGTSSSEKSEHRLLHEKRAPGKMALRRNQSLWKSAHVGDVLRSDTSRADTSGHEEASRAAALVLSSKGLCKPSLVSYFMYTIVTILFLTTSIFRNTLCSTCHKATRWFCALWQRVWNVYVLPWRLRLYSRSMSRWQKILMIMHQAPL